MLRSILNDRPFFLHPKATVYLEGWGISSEAMGALAARLNLALPELYWHTSATPLPGALALLLVDIDALTGASGHAQWNGAGPIDAMRRLRGTGLPVAVLCKGRASRLPLQREGVWIASGTMEWEDALQTVARVLASRAWTPQRGYRDLQGWSAVGKLLDANVLGVTASSSNPDDFSALLRQTSTASFTQPLVLVVAGVARQSFDRTLLEAGMDAVPCRVSAPMTLDSSQRIDMLAGFPWPHPN